VSVGADSAGGGESVTEGAEPGVAPSSEPGDAGASAGDAGVSTVGASAGAAGVEAVGALGVAAGASAAGACSAGAGAGAGAWTEGVSGTGAGASTGSCADAMPGAANSRARLRTQARKGAKRGLPCPNFACPLTRCKCASLARDSRANFSRLDTRRLEDTPRKNTSDAPVLRKLRHFSPHFAANHRRAPGRVGVAERKPSGARTQGGRSAPHTADRGRRDAKVCSRLGRLGSRLGRLGVLLAGVFFRRRFGHERRLQLLLDRLLGHDALLHVAP
jgi:hypothetical protein